MRKRQHRQEIVEALEQILAIEPGRIYLPHPMERQGYGGPKYMGDWSGPCAKCEQAQGIVREVISLVRNLTWDEACQKLRGILEMPPSVLEIFHHGAPEPSTRAILEAYCDPQNVKAKDICQTCGKIKKLVEGVLEKIEKVGGSKR